MLFYARYEIQMTTFLLDAEYFYNMNFQIYAMWMRNAATKSHSEEMICAVYKHRKINHCL